MIWLPKPKHIGWAVFLGLLVGSFWDPSLFELAFLIGASTWLGLTITFDSKSPTKATVSLAAASVAIVLAWAFWYANDDAWRNLREVEAEIERQCSGSLNAPVEAFCEEIRNQTYFSFHPE